MRRAPPSPRKRRENGARGARWFARVSWSLPVVAGAGSQVERCLELGLVQDDGIVGTSVHVGIWDLPLGSGIDESVGVVGYLISRGFGTTRFVEDRVLVRVLRGIVDDESAAVNGSGLRLVLLTLR